MPTFPTESVTGPPTELARAGGFDRALEDFAALEQSISSTIGVVIQPVGAASDPIRLGDWEEGPAWSTIKVPLAIAALRDTGSSTITDDIRAAITESDNAAAEALWQGLGDPPTAAQKVQAVMSDAGDPPTVQSQRIRPGFSAFGQTIWSLAGQTRFAAVSACDTRDDPVWALMGDISNGARWGLGTLPGARFKGGWGPDDVGIYLVRQLGVVTTPNGRVAVALATHSTSGSFKDGTNELSQIANWLSEHLDALPAGECSE